MHDIFLSYSRTDTDTMQRVKQSLLDADFTVWTDEGIDPGTRSWKRAIQKAILDTSCLVCLLSPDAAESRWVQEELDFAELHEKPIFLILARGNQREAIPFGFTTHQWVDIRDTGRYETRILSLIGVIQRRLNKVIGEIEAEDTQQASDTSEPAPLTEKDRITAELRKYLPAPFDLCEILIQGKEYSLYIGTYPITNRQFAEFIGDEGYRSHTFWHDDGWELCKQEKWTQPRYFHDVKWNGAKQPVVGITWYEALAFCSWLNSKSDNASVRLPYLHEWKKAARGDDNRKFPWGNSIENKRLNGFGKTGKTTPVDEYTEGASPYGVLDMAGNVWEWCNYRIFTLGDTPITGGSWIDTEEEKFRIDYTNSASPEKWSNNIGFRIAVTVKS